MVRGRKLLAASRKLLAAVPCCCAACGYACRWLAGKSRLLATRREAGRRGSKNTWCFFVIVLLFSFVLEIFSTYFTVHYNMDSDIDMFGTVMFVKIVSR